jgi:hypothetical protein
VRNHKASFAVLVVVAVACAVLAPVALAATKTHEVRSEVVSVNMEGKTITIKDEKGADKSVPVLESALASLKTIKAGDHVLITCQDDDKGMHQGVAAIKVEPMHPKS